MNNSGAEVVVKEEISESEEEKVEGLVYCDEWDCPDNVKVEESISEGERRRSRRLQSLEKVKPNTTEIVIKCVRKGLSEEKQAVLQVRTRQYNHKRKVQEASYAKKPQQKQVKNNQRATERKPLTQQELEEQKKRKRESYMKNKFRRLVKESEMTEEELERLKMERYLKAQAYKASKTKEEWAEYNAKRNEMTRKRREDESYRQSMIDRHRKWKQNLTEEKRQRYMNSVKKSVSKYLKNLKFKNPEKYNQNYEKYKEYLRKRTAAETPEKRQKRLLRYKINAARTKLRKRLELDGVKPEIIERKVTELVEEMKNQPLLPLSEYKPRPRRDAHEKKTKKTNNNLPNISTDHQLFNESVSTNSNDGESAVNNSYTYHLLPFVSPKEIKINNEPRLISNVPVLYQTLPASTSILISLSPPTLKDGSILGNSMQLASCKYKPNDEIYQLQEVNETIADGEDFPCPASPVVRADDNEDPFDEPATLSKIIEKVEEKPSVAHSHSLPPKNFNCPQCSETFSTDHELRNHLGNFHTLTCWKCPMCCLVMLSPLELSQHYKTHVEYPSHSRKSNSCPPKSPVQRKFLRKDKTKATGGLFLCMKCPYLPRCRSNKNKFNTLELLYAHVKKDHPKSFWPCSNCKVLKYSKNRLDFHQKTCSTTATLKGWKSGQSIVKKKNTFKIS